MQFIFKIGDKIKEVWPVYKIHFGTFLVLMVIVFVNQSIGSRNNWILSVISFILGILISYVWIKFSLSLVDKKEFNPFTKEALPTLSQFWNLFKTIILMMLCILGGAILFVIPAFYVSGRLIFATYLSIDKNQGARISVKESWNMTKGYGWKLFWKSVVISLFIMLGFIALFVGSFITYPIGMVIFAMMYREFVKFKSEGAIHVSSEVIN